MGFCEVLTIVFIVLKLCGVISWPWLGVLFPILLAVTFYVLLIGLFIFLWTIINIPHRSVKRYF